MIRARFIPYRLNFNFVAVTSRDRMTFKDTYFLILEDDRGRKGIGECALFRGLSCDDTPRYESVLADVCAAISNGEIPELTEYPSIRFGVETALKSLESKSPFILFPSAWTEGRDYMKINGLVWMGTAYEMKRRVRGKLEEGFSCIKLKIGGIDFESELDIIKSLRRVFHPDHLEIRLDANGGFTPENVMQRLEALSKYSIHSIEQPVKPRQYDLMARICRNSPIDIALDEELIGVNKKDEKYQLLSLLKPRYIILKPALTGGFSGADEWIEAAEENGIGWWATSALESNIGLNAIAQWCHSKEPTMPQGLGTGMLYTNNISSPLYIVGDKIAYNPCGEWNMPAELL